MSIRGTDATFTNLFSATSGVIATGVIEVETELKGVSVVDRAPLITDLVARAARPIPTRTRPAATIVPVSVKTVTPADVTTGNGTETAAIARTEGTAGTAADAISMTDPDETCLMTDPGAAVTETVTKTVTAAIVVTGGTGREVLHPQGERSLPRI